VKTIVHVNQHKIKANAKTAARVPVITVKTYKTNDYCNTVKIDGPCEVVYTPDDPLPCGAKVYIVTDSKVECIE
jgi:hypothetical protein